MLLTRWKLMAGVLGVSIGGLAAAASQCPKLDKTKGRQPEAPPTAEAPKLPPAGAPSPAAPPALPMPGMPAPAFPQALTLPDAPKPAAELPKLPDPSVTPLPGVSPPMPSKPDEVKPASGSLTLPTLPDAKPEPKTAPKVAPIADLPPAAIPPAPTGSAPLTKPASNPLPSFDPPAGKPTPPAPSPVMPIGGTAAQPPLPTPEKEPVAKPPLPTPTAEVPPAAKPPALIEPPAPAAEVPPSKPAPAPTADVVKVGAVKYRILLRVGEGEPTFEVKNGDDLVLKVACEKVDIKSPEKGAGPSSVTARGKVRFAGFGVEGTCEELSFMAGTGEVSMAGDVKVQMKDKLGRVESELTTATLKYKIDASVIGGAIRP